MPENNDGHITKGQHLSVSTEFKKGQHWRERKPYWDREWLFNEYVSKKRTSADIAKEFNISANGICFWLSKHKIPSRGMSEIRKIKKWGVAGSKNGMYGRFGNLSPTWKGGCTPERQAFYCSHEWITIVKQVFIRDKYTCQRCGMSKHGLHIHHIISFRYKLYRLVLDNLILLCPNCHRFVHSKKNIVGEFIVRHI